MSKEAKMVLENRLKIKLTEKLTDFQKEVIMKIIDDCLLGFNVELGTIEDYDSEQLLNAYLNALEVQGRSPKTISHYKYEIQRLMDKTEVPIQDMTIVNLRDYLSYEKEHGLSNETLEGNRQVFSAFFGWLHREGLIHKNPVANLGAIKRTKKIRKVYSEIDIEKLKSNCKTVRDKAIVCFLYSTGCRISEMTQLNITDINFETLECLVLGKGDKERTVYMDEITGMVLSEYIKKRKDTNEALFVSTLSPYKRIEPGGVRIMLHQLEQKAGVEHVHPHKFRRTRATRLAKHGMPIQEVAAFLGHEKIDTTMKYVVMNKNDIKTSYQKYV